MKKAALILTIIGMILTAIVSIMNIVSYLAIPVMVIMYVIMTIADIIVGILVIKSLSDNDRKVALGVLSIIFVSPLSGIFYLCWKPESNYHQTKTILESAINWDEYDKLSNDEKRNYLNRLWFQGKISKNRYDELLNELDPQ